MAVAKLLGSVGAGILSGVAKTIAAHGNDNYVPSTSDISGSQQLAEAAMNSNLKTPDAIKAITMDNGPTLSGPFRVGKIDSGDVFKALQQVANENAKATTIVQKDIANVYTFLSKQTSRTMAQLDLVGRQVGTISSQQKSLDSEIKRLKYQISNMSFSKPKQAAMGFGAANDNNFITGRAANDNANNSGNNWGGVISGGAAAVGGASLLKRMTGGLKSGGRTAIGYGKSMLERVPKGSLKGGLIGIGTQLAGEYAMDKAMGTPDDQYKINEQKYGKDKAEELRRVQTEGSWDRIKRLGNSFMALEPNIKAGRLPEAEVTQEGQEKPGFFRRMLSQVGNAGMPEGTTAWGRMNETAPGRVSSRAGNSGSQLPEGYASHFNRGAFAAGESKGSFPRMAEIKASMLNQAIQQGLPKDRAEMLANVLVGQAISESGLKSQFHDAGKRLGTEGGYVPSIYGADKARGQAMHAWMKTQGLDPNDTTHQGAWMVNEWMTKFPKLAAAAKDPNVSQDDLSRMGTVTYEAPATRHSPATQAERIANANKAGAVKLNEEAPGAQSAPNTPVDTKPTVIAAKPAQPASFSVAPGSKASMAIGSDGKLGGLALTMGRGQLLGGIEPIMNKLPKDIQDHLKNSKEIDMNKLAPYAHMLPPDVRKGMADNGLLFKDAVAATSEQTIKPQTQAVSAAGVQPSVAAFSNVSKSGTWDGKITKGDDNRVIQEQSKVAATRKGKIDESLNKQLNFAANKTGVFAEVFSGGQRMHGAEGAVGSHRHDHGGAADIKLFEMVNGQKRYLDASNPADKVRMSQFVSHSVAAGATGVGHGAGYMGNQSLHIGGGSATSWGGSDWIEGARQQGVAQRSNVQNIDVAARLTPTERAAMTQQATDNPNWATTVAGNAPVPASSFDDRFGSWDKTSKEVGVSSRAGSTKRIVEESQPTATPVQPEIKAVPYAPPQEPMPTVALPEGGVGDTAGWQPQEKQIAKDPSVFDKGTEPVKNLEGGSSGRGNRGESGGLRSPTNNPEQMNPTPGNNGYGEQSSPDGVGLCSV